MQSRSNGGPAEHLITPEGATVWIDSERLQEVVSSLWLLDEQEQERGCAHNPTPIEADEVVCSGHAPQNAENYNSSLHRRGDLAADAQEDQAAYRSLTQGAQPPTSEGDGVMSPDSVSVVRCIR